MVLTAVHCRLQHGSHWAVQHWLWLMLRDGLFSAVSSCGVISSVVGALVRITRGPGFNYQLHCLNFSVSPSPCQYCLLFDLCVGMVQVKHQFFFPTTPLYVKSMPGHKHIVLDSETFTCQAGNSQKYAHYWWVIHFRPIKLSPRIILLIWMYFCCWNFCCSQHEASEDVYLFWSVRSDPLYFAIQSKKHVRTSICFEV